jgi:G3E family GTPase
MAHPVLLQAYRLEGVVTLVDAVHGEATLDRHVESVKQVAVADRLVIAKTDLAGEAAVKSLETRLRRLNPSAALLRSPAAAPGALFDAGLYDPSTKSADVRRWLGEAAAAAGHHDHPHGTHTHRHDGDGRHRHDARIGSLSLVHDGPLPFAAIEAFVDLLRSSHGERLLRLKGVIELSENPEHPLVVHGVQNILHPPVFLPAWPDGIRGTRLVLITLDIDENHVRRMFDAVTGRPSIDAPDRAALLDNPLSTAGFG